MPETFLRELIRNLVESQPMRSGRPGAAGIRRHPVLLPKRTHNLTRPWVAETAEHDVSRAGYDQQSVVDLRGQGDRRGHATSCSRTSAFDLAAELSRDFAEEFARLEGVAFVDGNGTTEPADGSDVGDLSRPSAARSTPMT